MTSDQMKLAALERRIQEEENKVEAIFYGSQTPMVVFRGSEAIIEKFNKSYQNIYPHRELLEKSILEVVPELEGSPFPIILKNIYETGDPHYSREGMVRILNPETNELEERYFDTTFSRISFGANEPYRILAIPREVTDRVQARKKIEDNLRELENERELREKFVSALSHDLRTPLAIAKMCAQTLKMDESEEVAEMADRISQSVDRADRMIRNLLDANRIKGGMDLTLSFKDCRLDQILNYIVDDLKEIYGPRLQIVNKVGEVRGSWDDLAIHRMVENLAVNAIKYGSPETKVTVALDIKNTWAEINVHNEGNPISLEEQKYLFQEYRRSKYALKSGQVGWGIGLALVKGLAEAHGGAVQVESNLESGTKFIIQLPL